MLVTECHIGTKYVIEWSGRAQYKRVGHSSTESRTVVHRQEGAGSVLARRIPPPSFGSITQDRAFEHQTTLESRIISDFQFWTFERGRQTV